MTRSSAGASLRTALWAIFTLGLWCAAALIARGQDSLPQLGQQAPIVDRTLATLHGVVRNAVTGEGVPRSLVRIEGDADTGALTDGDGRFEIPGVPVGPQEVAVRKPGFLDPAYNDEGQAEGGEAGAPHNVLVATEMPDVVFTLTPACAIVGRIDLSTGDPAEGIEVGLVRRTIVDGRAIWEANGFTKTRSDGRYRFGELVDGEYEVYTRPSLDSEPAAILVAPGSASAAERWGFASVFYPDARDPSSAAKISVANGEETQANFTLTREPFENVAAAVTLPQDAAASQPAMRFSAQVLDAAGHQLPYAAQYDQKSQTIQAALPDGEYSMLVSTIPGQMQMEGGLRRIGSGGDVLVGMVNFSIAGHAVTGLRVPLSQPTPAPVQVTVIRGGAASEQEQNNRITVMMSQAGGWMGGGMVGEYATGTAEGPLEASYLAPGAYWAHTYIGGRQLCESSFTAGGASLAREPVSVGLSGAAAPMELALRDDCARLTLSLPENLDSMAAGEERFYTAYVVPDFDFTGDLNPAVLRPSTQGTATLDGLTPGNYHVYTLEGDARLEYRNPAVLAALPGQAITLSPGATSDLVVEAPGQ